MTWSLRNGLRKWRRTPGLAWTMITILAVGIAVNSVVFSTVDSILLRPLPYPESRELVHLFQVDPQRGIDQLRFPLPSFAELRAEAGEFIRLAAYDYTECNLAGGGDPQRIQVSRVTSGLFGVLGVRPRLGPGLELSGDRSGPERLVVLSDGLWHRGFAGDPSVVGETVRLDDVPYTVAGVMAPGFNFPFPGVEAWITLPMDLQVYTADKPWFQVLGRMRPGVSRTEARERLVSLHAGIHRDLLGTTPVPGLRVVPLREALTFYYETVRLTSLFLMAAVALGLLIACSNVASLLLARGAGREAEMAVRTALGASRSQLLRQALSESAMLAAAAGVVGLALAHWGIGLLASVIPPELYRVGEITLDGRVVAFTAGVCFFTVLAFGLAPALELSRSGRTRVLHGSGGRVEGTRRGGRLRRAFVVTQIALACSLLVGAVVVYRSLEGLRAVKPGLDGRDVLTVQLTLPPAKYGETPRLLGFFDRLIQGVSSLPETRSAAMVFPLPLDFEVHLGEFRIEGREPTGPGERLFAATARATPGYLETVGIPLLWGRFFSEADGRETPQVAVVNQTMAERYWPGGDPVGARLHLGPASGESLEVAVVGVVGDVSNRGLEEGVRPQIYRPWDQSPLLGGHLLVRTASMPPESLVPEVRRAVWAVDSGLPISGARSLEDVAEGSLLPWRVSASLLAALAAGALLLAAAGLYGLTAHLVLERRREIAIRLALGADGGGLLRLLMLQGTRLAAIGLAVGTVLGLGLTRLGGSLLYEVSMTDPYAVLGVPAFLAVVIFTATYVPARKAMRLEPRSNLN